MQEKEQKISPIKQRILQFADNLRISKRKFYEEIGVSRGTLEAKTGITEDVLAKFIATYPQVNILWLMTGKGEMLRNNSEISTIATPFTASGSDSSQAGTCDNVSTLPLIPFDALAGIPSIDNFGIAFADCDQYYIPEFAARGTDFLIRVSGSSMYPKYSNGDLLACTLVRDILFFQWGKVYVIDSSQGVLVKRIFPSNHPDCISLVSDNSEHYPPFDFPKSDIRTLAIVSGVIRFE